MNNRHKSVRLNTRKRVLRIGRAKGWVKLSSARQTDNYTKSDATRVCSPISSKFALTPFVAYFISWRRDVIVRDQNTFFFKLLNKTINVCKRIRAPIRIGRSSKGPSENSLSTSSSQRSLDETSRLCKGSSRASSRLAISVP